jgi:hypothetical protein
VIARARKTRDLEILVDDGDRYRTFADAGCHAFDRSRGTSPIAKMPGTVVSKR